MIESYRVEEVARSLAESAAVPQSDLVPADRLDPRFEPLGLTEAEVDALVAFLKGGLYDPDVARYVPASVPSGNCIPNNDPQSRRDLGCE